MAVAGSSAVPGLKGSTTGDPGGAGYTATAIPLQRPDGHLSQLGNEARRQFERRYATVEITDSVAMLGGHQVALIRGYHDRLQQAVEALQDDVLNRSPNYHQMTAVLDKIAAGELLARRQDMAANQLFPRAGTTPRQEQTRARYRERPRSTCSSPRGATAGGECGIRRRNRRALRTWRQP